MKLKLYGQPIWFKISDTHRKFKMLVKLLCINMQAYPSQQVTTVRSVLLIELEMYSACQIPLINGHVLELRNLHS